MSLFEQLKAELEKYEAAHGTARRHPDGRLKSRQMIALIGRAVLELAPDKPVFQDETGNLWTRGPSPGVLHCCGMRWEPDCPADLVDHRYRAACAALWPDFELPDA